MTVIYRMHDACPAGVFETSPSEAKSWNAKGFGIFWAVNEFNGARRIENLKRIRAWAIDLDSGAKAEQRLRIQGSPLVPSKVVEVKRGYHVYWKCKGEASASNWNAIVLHRLVPFFGADPNARDLARILRVPGFYHCKDPQDPFLVQEVFTHPVTYSEEAMAQAFPDQKRDDREEKAKQRARVEIKQVDTSGGDFWEGIYLLDCEDALSRLSGHYAVGGERYTFKSTRSGNKNIFVDGKGTSCFIDANGRIGSLDEGGPTLWNWLRWFKNSPKDCAEIIKNLYPELRKL